MPMAGPNETPTPSTPHGALQSAAPAHSGTPGSTAAGTALLPSTPNAAAAILGVSSKTWELSDYELNRLPQEAITDGSEIAVSPRALDSELMCPICLDMLHNTMTTKECLHRFCSECIITALRSGNKECPTCRKKLVSKRSLRHDPNFDTLISKIYPSRDEYEQQQQKQMARFTKIAQQNQAAQAHMSQQSIEEGMKQQLLQRKAMQQQQQQQKLNGVGTPMEVDLPMSAPGAPGTVSGVSISTSAPPGTGTTNNPKVLAAATAAAGTNGHGHSHSAVAATAAMGTLNLKKSESERSVAGESCTSGSSGYSEEVTEVELVFKPHPDMLRSSAGTPGIPTGFQNQVRYIKTTANASVGHLASYLKMRLTLDSTPEVANPAASSALNNCMIFICPSAAASGSPDGPTNSGANTSTPSGPFILIPQNQTLAAVCEKYWKFNKPLEMYYSWKK